MRPPGLHGLFARALSVLFVVVAPAAAEGTRDATRPEPESYVLHCSGCHRLDGRGVEGVAPDLHEIGTLLDSPDGRAYLGRVPGVAQAPIDDAALARLLNWVLEEFAGKRPEPLYDGAEIARLRADPLRDPVAARRKLSAPPGIPPKP